MSLELEERGLESLYRELIECDYTFARKVHPNDKQRIFRGVEVYRYTGKPISSFYNRKRGFETRDTLYVGLYMERDELKRRIDERVDKMIKAGFIEEVNNLRQMGYDPDLNSMKSIGYMELNEYIDGKLGLVEAIEKVKIETKRFAKRQMTWFRRNKRIHWFKILEIEKIRVLIDNWLSAFYNNKHTGRGR